MAIASTRPDAQVWAVDRSAEALAVAARNAARLLDAERARRRADVACKATGTHALDAALRFDVIVSNPPYIASGDPHLSEGDLRFEPRGALTDEADGLSAIRAIVAGRAHTASAADGALWIEHGYDQAAAVRALLTAHGFAEVRSERDLAGIERISGGRSRRPDAAALSGRRTPQSGRSAGRTEIRYHFSSIPYNHNGTARSVMDTQQRIKQIVDENHVVLFMKGTAQFPMCGFSGRAIQILKACGVDEIKTVNVLEDDEVRQGIKEFSNWPTIPQLYVNGEFVGGSDIMMEMYESGELQQLFAAA